MSYRKRATMKHNKSYTYYIQADGHIASYAGARTATECLEALARPSHIHEFPSTLKAKNPKRGIVEDLVSLMKVSS